MQELQCADCIMNFLETERESHIRDYIFELLFDDIHQASTKYILQLLLSYSVSLEAQNTLECISKWIIINIGNEMIQNIFNQLIRDHFLLVINENEQPTQNLINLARIAPLFTSLFMTIVLDMLANNLITNHEKCLNKLFNLFDIWISRDPILPVLAYRANITHASSYLFNPLPGLLFISVVYPIKVALECFQIHSNEHTKRNKNDKDKIAVSKRIELCKQNAQLLDELSSKVHFMSLKLVKDLESLAVNNASESFKLLNFKHIEAIKRLIDDLNAAIRNQNINNLCFHSIKSLNEIKDDCLDKLAQLLEILWQFDFINCNKQEIRTLFSNIIEQTSESLLAIVLNNG